MRGYKNTKKMIAGIKKNANICIYGSNNIAEKIFNLIKENRDDVNVRFFIDTNKKGKILNIPILNPIELYDRLNEIDEVVVASFSAGYYLELILNSIGIKNVVKIDDKAFYELSLSLKKIPDISETVKVFKTKKDKKLYKLLFNYRFKGDKDKNVRKYFEDNNKEIITGYGDGNSYSLKHYFEYINPEPIKTVVDAGAYDGLFSLMFLQKFPNCSKVYAFEPCYKSFKAPVLDEIIKKDNRIEIIPRGLWHEKTKLEFREELEAKIGSGVVSVKKDFNRPQKIISIETETIDNFVLKNNVKIDFIKMDIENSEMNALNGAIKTIISQRPQLAISIYHSDEQFQDVPMFLHENLKNYVFRLGHYSPKKLETVIYAIPKELMR